ncbi:acetyltransferase [Mucilaginibacter calamicampi]|uniref:Acetyltransferase n=1 Tax=Mucilaginibacter calamicampi TaxID=1302352 RepID=A0ABW2YTK7_9SPHI
MSRKAIIVGYSGHSYVVLDILLSNNYEIKGYCDLTENQKNPYKLSYLGSENHPDNLNILLQHDVFISIGANEIRKKLFEKLLSKQISCPSVLHPNCSVSASAEIMQGTIVMPGVIINACAKIGNAVICNSAAVIEHECIINDFVHIAPGAILAGNVTVGKESFIGANSVIKQGVKIGERVIIGAGSVILNDIADDTIVYGNPGRIK